MVSVVAWNVGKTGVKVVASAINPALGLALDLAEAAYHIHKGDYLDAAISLGSTVVLSKATSNIIKGIGEKTVVIKCTTNEMLKETATGATKGVAKEAVKETGKTIGKEAGKGTAKCTIEAGKEIGKKFVKDYAKETGHELSELAVKKSILAVSKRTGTEGVKMLGHELLARAATQVEKQAFTEAAAAGFKDIIKPPVKEVIKTSKMEVGLATVIALTAVGKAVQIKCDNDD